MSIGAVLSQIQGGKECVVTYASWTLGKVEHNYSVTDCELLAIKYFMGYYKHYLLSRKFVVRTDHNVLRWLLSLNDIKHHITRWIEATPAFHSKPFTKFAIDWGSSMGMLMECHTDLYIRTAAV